jgi:hypothetical protein
MGNPASVKRKLKEKRRKRHEERLGVGAYLPKEERARLQAELEKIEAAETKDKEARVAARKAEKAKKPEAGKKPEAAKKPEPAKKPDAAKE